LYDFTIGVNDLMIRPTHDSTSEIDLICPECGYDLRGIESERCPECGKPFDRATASRSLIPWMHRGQIGRVRAFARTVWLATSNIKALSAEITRPVSLREAQRFRLIAVVLASLTPILILVIVLHEIGGTALFALPISAGNMRFNPVGLPPAMSFTLPWYAGVLLWPTMPLAIFVFLYLASGVGSYWFHPKDLSIVRQNRAVALSHYSCAPIVWLFIPLISGTLGIVFGNSELTNRHTRFTVAAAGICVALTFVVAICVICLTNTLRLMRRTIEPTGMRLWSAGVGLPVMWMLCAGVAFGVMPWLVGLIFVMIDSLH
jgi:hypothetical protein